MALAPVAALHAPGARPSIVVHRDVVVEDAGLGGIEMHPLLDHGLAVRMERGAVAVKDARAAQAAGLDRQSVEMAVVALPAADGIARKARHDRGRPGAA